MFGQIKKYSSHKLMFKGGGGYYHEGIPLHVVGTHYPHLNTKHSIWNNLG